VQKGSGVGQFGRYGYLPGLVFVQVKGAAGKQGKARPGGFAQKEGGEPGKVENVPVYAAQHGINAVPDGEHRAFQIPDRFCHSDTAYILAFTNLTEAGAHKGGLAVSSLFLLLTWSVPKLIITYGDLKHLLLYFQAELRFKERCDETLSCFSCFNF
jgi:hypothetical protein